MKVDKSYFLNEDVVFLARNLIGKRLFTNINGKRCSGIISETEAYAGITDKASHAYGGRRTARTEVMFLEGGRTYVYFCYGMHYLLNFVTAKAGIPHAVLIRGIVPDEGVEIMFERTGKNKLKGLTDGPAKLCKAMGISTKHNNLPLNENTIWVDDNINFTTFDIIESKRIGIVYAEEDALLPWRFELK